MFRKGNQPIQNYTGTNRLQRQKGVGGVGRQARLCVRLAGVLEYL